MYFQFSFFQYFAFSHDNQYIATYQWEESDKSFFGTDKIPILDASTFKQIALLPWVKSGYKSDRCYWSPNGKYLFFGELGKIKVYYTLTWQLFKTIQAPNYVYKSIVFLF